jgi:hypothetical protein
VGSIPASRTSISSKRKADVQKTSAFFFVRFDTPDFIACPRVH